MDFLEKNNSLKTVDQIGKLMGDENVVSMSNVKFAEIYNSSVVIVRKEAQPRKMAAVRNFQKRDLSKPAGQLATLWVPTINKVTQWTREKTAYHQQHHKQQEPGAGECWLSCLLVPWWDTMGPYCCSAHNGLYCSCRAQS